MNARLLMGDRNEKDFAAMDCTDHDAWGSVTAQWLNGSKQKSKVSQ